MPAPYQTYIPGEAPVPILPPTPLVVYGATTTMPDMVPDAVPIAPPVPAPPAATSAPASNKVAICYNRLWNKAETVKTAAAQACGGAPAPQITSQGVDIEACPLLTPTKAVFACSAAKSP